MLQFFINSNDPAEVISQAKQALEGGCKWIQVNSLNESNEDDLKSIVSTLKELCTENNAMLVLKENQDIVKSLKLDGIYFDNIDKKFSKLREEIGEEIILGVKVSTVDELKALSPTLVDYIVYENNATPEHVSIMKEIISQAHILGKELPVVIYGTKDVDEIMSYGADGVAIPNCGDDTTTIITKTLESLKQNID